MMLFFMLKTSELRNKCYLIMVCRLFNHYQVLFIKILFKIIILFFLSLLPFNLSFIKILSLVEKEVVLTTLTWR